MNDRYFSWKKLKNSGTETITAENTLRDLENNYVSACARFLSRVPSKDPVWTLKGKNNEIAAMIVNAKTTVIPVFNGRTEMPLPKFLGGFFQINKIHSIQGLKEEVLILEEVIKQFGKKVSDIFDYDLMSLESVKRDLLTPGGEQKAGLVLRVPSLTDLDALAPLQAAYEHEEVLHKGSVFSHAASRINLARIIAEGKILAAEMNGHLIGKINVSGVSFSRYLIGGVYVHPEFRSRGIARQMTAKFLASLIDDNPANLKGLTLFVKKSNHPARKLYERLGFQTRRDYRITYFYE